MIKERRPDAKNNFFTLQSLKSLHLIAADGNSSALQTVRIFLDCSYSYFIYCLHQLCKSFDCPFHASVKRSKHA